MAIETGQSIPAGKLTECVEFDPHNGCPMNPQPLDVQEMANGKTIVLFAVPGAFTPLCSAQHLPGFVALADEIKAAGADEIWCMSVNDAFVMAAWGRENQVTGKVRMMADGSAEYAKALGLDRDLTGGGMGIRAYRFAMIIDNGVVRYIGVEGSGEFGKSKAETILEQLKK
ncbi:antioxidant, AhpC/Tsa family [Methylophaga frappieri]|uniref:Glutathione-dependent peroxiredoxin n=1 Tax=Methylophaga frappieri (strain ATCC BAA-2434 / DSM 25690 / JAM7) TaxID=754477 RepID=I1YH58_METFJ|nr:peroxiredoxin [Methylophaga frappieri]AFJ02251.1 antioxidant, AhpC/Tsa family [Methylophaga frappieri]